MNKTNSGKTIAIGAEMENAASLTVDEETGDDPPRAGIVHGDTWTMAPFAVTVLKLQ